MKLYILSILGVFFLLGCNTEKRNKETLITRETEKSFYNSDLLPVQLIQENEDITYLYLEDSVKVTFIGYKQKGDFKVKLKEYNSPSEIIINGLNTMSTDGLLETAKMFKVEVFDSKNNPIGVNQFNKVRIEFLNNQLEGYNLYYREAEPDKKWEVDTLSEVWDYIYHCGENIKVIDSTKRWRYDNLYDLNSFGWVNVDKLYMDEELVIFEVNSFGKEIELNIVFQEQKLLLKVYRDQNGRNYLELPKDKNISLVAYVKKDKEYSYSISSHSTSDGVVDISNLSEFKSFNDFKTMLEKELDGSW